MPNYGNYYIGICLLLLKEYLQANAGSKRPIKRKDLQSFLSKQGFPVEKKTLYAGCGCALDFTVHSSALLRILFLGSDAGGLPFTQKNKKSLET